ncbi:hypothetical protein H0H92_009817, partial [Tricholoma furcatifolium]
MQWSVFNDDIDGEIKRKQFDALKKRLGNWFRHRYQYVNSNKQANGIVKDIISAMVETASIGSKNQKMTAMKLYRERNWDSSLKEEFQGEWDEFKKANEVTSDRDRLKHCNRFIKRKFGEETDEYIAELTTEASRLNKENDRAKKGKAPETPQEFQRAIDDAGKTLYPMAEAIAQSLGTVVVIMCCGINSDGEIEVQSAQSKTDASCVSSLWPQWDPTNFSIAEKSLKAYGNVFFSKEDRQARIIVPEDDVIDISDSEDEAAKPSDAASMPEARATKSPSSSSSIPAPPSTPTLTPQTPQNVANDIEDPRAESKVDGEVNLHVTKPSSTSASTTPSSPLILPVTTPTTPKSVPTATGVSLMTPATSTLSTTPESSEGIVSGVTVEDVAVPPAPPSAERTSPLSTTPDAIGGQVGGLEKEVGDVVVGDVEAAGAAKPVPIDLASRAVVRPAPRPVAPKQVQDEPTQSVIPLRSPTKDLKALIPIDNVGMRSAIDYLSNKAWGEDWYNCIEALVEFERAKEFP